MRLPDALEKLPNGKRREEFQQTEVNNSGVQRETDDDRGAIPTERAEQRNIQVHLPGDLVISDRFGDDGEVKTVASGQVPDDWFIMDVGDDTAKQFARELAACRTIIWNGPMGVFEIPRFSQGTRMVAQGIAGAEGVTTVVGGGSTAEAVEEMGLMDRMTHVSTGGGASLEFLEGKELPGIAALPEA